MKSLLISVTIATLLFACVIVFGPKQDERIAVDAGLASRGPWFAVRVEKPRAARPLFGLLPTDLEAKLAGHGDLVFSQTSPGALIDDVSDHRLALRADGWSLTIETNQDGMITSDTHLVLPLMLANRQRTLRCRPADPAQGYLRAATPSGPDTRAQDFRVEMARCENTETGQTIEWPPAPLTVIGSVQTAPQLP